MFVEASVGVLGARMAVRAVPFRTLRSVTAKLKRGMQRYAALRATEPADAHVVAEAIERAGRQIPGASCLPRALAGYVLLARHGHESQLRIGVRAPSDGLFAAHAWLEQDGEVLVGGPRTSRFITFSSFYA